MSYVQLFASADVWLTSEEYFVYLDDTDGVPRPKMANVLNTITTLAEEDETVVTIHTISHYHLDDGRQCDCVQFYQSTPTVIDGRKRDRHV